VSTSETEPLVCLRYFGPEVNPDAPAMGAYRKNKFSATISKAIQKLAAQCISPCGFVFRNPPSH